MFCARCGQQIPDASEICPLCRREANIQLQPAPALEMAAPAARQSFSPTSTPLSGPQGVGGWLKFFCFTVTIIGPLFLTVQVVSLGTMPSRYYVIDLVRAAYGMVVGVFLWARRPHALSLLRAYFIVVLATAVLGSLGLVLTGLRRGWASMFLSAGFTPVAQLLAYTMIWFAYFRKSRRVRNTYGRNI